MTLPAYRTADVDGFEIFYREAGDRAKPMPLEPPVTRMCEDGCSRIPQRYGNYTCHLLENFVPRCDN